MSEKEIYERLHDCLKNNKVISRSLIANFIYLNLDKYDLGDYNICLYNKDLDVRGCFSHNRKEIFVNYKKIMNESKKNSDINVSFLETIYHEITHLVQTKIVLQEYKLDDRLKSYYDYLKLSLQVADMDDDIYNKNHDKFIFEYQAIVNSLLKVATLYDEMDINYKTSYINNKLGEYILKYYSTSYPIEITNKIINKYYDYPLNLLIPDIDNYNKLLFGYPLDDEIINQISSTIEEKKDIIKILKR